MGDSTTLELQDVLKDFWVGQKLGTGARSVVYAVKRKKDGKAFAAKFLWVRMPEDLRLVGHMENEFRVLKALHAKESEASAVIVRPLLFEKVRQRLQVKAAYLVMELAKGQSLFAFRDYSLMDVLAIFRQVCIALEHIHEVGYVHADLKPQNILVDDELHVKLVDFGFAAPVGQKLTAYKGTFGYLAPEQAGGRVTEQTDVFNLGAALYRVLTGENLPSIMPGAQEVRGYVPDQHVTITSPSRLNPQVPEELSEMVLKCCRPKEHERPTVKQLKQYMHGLQLRIEYGMV